MKKFVLIMIISMIAISGISAEADLIVKPFAGISLGSEDALRGGGGGVHVQYNVLGTGIHLGTWAAVNYDIWYSNASLPVALTLGKDFYILAGTTFDLSTATNPATLTATAPAGFFNTFGLGFNTPLIPFSDSMILGANAELVYTNYVAESTGDDVGDAFGALAGLIANIKLFASINLAFLF